MRVFNFKIFLNSHSLINVDVSIEFIFLFN
nr:hypothetical protein [Tanacetum cinerariifolium]